MCVFNKNSSLKGRKVVAFRASNQFLSFTAYFCMGLAQKQHYFGVVGNEYFIEGK
jgi:hypothetical protein